MSRITGEGSGWNRSQPTADLSELALRKLTAGDTGAEFTKIAGYLQTCTAVLPAMTEGTLLFAGAVLHEGVETIRVRREAFETAQANKDNPANDGYGLRIHNPINMNDMFAYLEYVQSGTTQRGLRPVGHKILEHCLGLSAYDEALAETAAKLALIKQFAQNAPSAN